MEGSKKVHTVGCHAQWGRKRVHTTKVKATMQGSVRGGAQVSAKMIALNITVWSCASAGQNVRGRRHAVVRVVEHGVQATAVDALSADEGDRGQVARGR